MKYKEGKIKNHNKQNYKKILIVLFVVIFTLLCLSLCLSMMQKKLEEPELSYDNIKTVIINKKCITDLKQPKIIREDKRAAEKKEEMELKPDGTQG